MGRCLGSGILGEGGGRRVGGKGKGRNGEAEVRSRIPIASCRVLLSMSDSRRMYSTEIEAREGEWDPEGRGRITQGALENEGKKGSAPKGEVRQDQDTRGCIEGGPTGGGMN